MFETIDFELWYTYDNPIMFVAATIVIINRENLKRNINEWIIDQINLLITEYVIGALNNDFSKIAIFRVQTVLVSAG